MAFTVTFLIDIGTHVIVDYEGVDLSDPKNLHGRFGTIACYQCVMNDDNYIVMVSGYKDAWCGEYLLSKVLVATDEQIEMYKKEMGIEDEDR